MRTGLFISFLLFLVSVPSVAASVPLLDPQNVRGIELLTSDGTLDRPQAFFGHAMLRFVSTERNELMDVVFGFEADTRDASDVGVVVKGALGTFAMTGVVMSLGDAIEAYSVLDQLGLKRTPLRLTRTEIDSLVSVTNQVLQRQIAIPHYSFFSFNCSTALAWLFTRAAIPIVAYALIPGQMDIGLSESLLAPWPELVTPSISRILAPLKAVSVYERGDLRWRIPLLEVAKIKPAAAYILYVSDLEFTRETEKALKFQIANFSMDPVEVYGVRALPACAYVVGDETVAETQACFADLKNHYSARELEVSLAAFWSARNQILQQVDWNPERSPKAFRGVLAAGRDRGLPRFLKISD